MNRALWVLERKRFGWFWSSASRVSRKPSGRRPLRANIMLQTHTHQCSQGAVHKGNQYFTRTIYRMTRFLQNKKMDKSQFLDDMVYFYRSDLRSVAVKPGCEGDGTLECSSERAVRVSPRPHPTLVLVPTPRTGDGGGAAADTASEDLTEVLEPTTTTTRFSNQ